MYRNVQNKLFRKYGKVFSMSMGGITCVVIADPAVLKRCFAKEEFCASPPLGMLRRIMRVIRNS